MWHFLAAAVGPLAKRVLVALGVGVVSYGALTTLANNVIAQIQAQFQGMPVSVLQIATLGGIPDAVSIICGAVLARVAVVAVSRFGRVAT
jgi:hypothetical protein